MKWTIHQYYHDLVKDVLGPAIDAATPSDDRRGRPRPPAKGRVASFTVKPVLQHIAALAVTMALVATAHGQTTKFHNGWAHDCLVNVGLTREGSPPARQASANVEAREQAEAEARQRYETQNLKEQYAAALARAKRRTTHSLPR